MGRHRFSIEIAAPPADVFDLWVNLNRMHEWTEGVTKVTDVTGQPGAAGTRYTVWFGRMSSPTEILDADPPRLIRTRFGNRVLRGTTIVRFERVDGGTRLTQEFMTEGLIPALTARIFATGSYKGSFRGELEAFRRIAEREAAQRASPDRPVAAHDERYEAARVRASEFMARSKPRGGRKWTRDDIYAERLDRTRRKHG